ncbi:MAG: ABC transporter ATP-binding protein [Balneolaceae bacterium]|nr:ABC transporter ATP-binding protein [Balneolaceae bacterium]
MSRLQIRDVSKYYGNQAALEGVSLEMDSGILGLLGPNGAGKSTLMRIVATIAEPSGGSVWWNERPISDNPNRLRSVLGYLPQQFGVYPHLTAREFLRYLSAAKGVHAPERVEDLLARVNLTEYADRRLETYSGGMKQRAGIAQALLNDPELLIVDEPSSGLDPEERARFRNLLSELAGDRIVILSTHIVSDVEAVADRIAVLRDGHLLADQPPGTLLAWAEGRVWELTVDTGRLSAYRDTYTITSATHSPQGTRIRLVSESSPEGNARSVTPSLEDAYLLLMNQEIPNRDNRS